MDLEKIDSMVRIVVVLVDPVSACVVALGHLCDDVLILDFQGFRVDLSLNASHEHQLKVFR